MNAGRKISIVGVLTLLISLLVPANQAYSSAGEFTSNPQSGSTLKVGDQATLSNTIAPTSDFQQPLLSQTWQQGEAALKEVSSPSGWSLEYLVDGTWGNSSPLDTSLISGVRTSSGGSFSSSSVRSVSSNATLISSATASVPGFGDSGDGWDVIPTPNFILNVNHHEPSYKLVCHLRNGDACGENPVYQVAGFYTGGASSGTYYAGKIYSTAIAYDDYRVVTLCTDVHAWPFQSCGVTTIDPTNSNNTATPMFLSNALSNQSFDGTRIWTANSISAKLMCFNVATQQACSPIIIDGTGRGQDDPSRWQVPSWTSFIAGKVFLNSDKLYCYVPSTGLNCAGAWPVATGVGTYQANVIPQRDETGTITGVCSISIDRACHNLDGTASDMPETLFALLTTHPTWFLQAENWMSALAWTSTKQYWQSGYGAFYNLNKAQCFDWATLSSCSGFNSMTDIGTTRYAFTVDPFQKDCIWTNGNDSYISSFDALTGEPGCSVGETISSANFTGFEKTSCDNVYGSIRSFNSLTVNLPIGSTFDRDDLQMSISDGNGTPISGFQNIRVSNGLVDLSGLSVADTTNSFRVDFESATEAALSDDDAAGIVATLNYTADSYQLCVTLEMTRTTCPEAYEAGKPPIFDVTVNSENSYSVGQVISSAKKSTFHVGPNAADPCYVWKGFLNNRGLGVSQAPGTNASYINSVVYGPDGKMYVAGRFSGAGSDTTAVDIAVWDGQTWSAVPGIGSAFSDRGENSYDIRTLAFSPSGKLLIGGFFEDAGGINDADYFAIYNPKTKLLYAPNYGPQGIVESIVVNQNNTVFLGGSFDNFYGSVAAFALEEMSWIGFGGFPGGALKLFISGAGRLYAVGGMENRVIRYDGWTDSWIPVSNDENQSTYVPSTVRAITVTSNKLYVAGDYWGVSVLDLTSGNWSWLGNSNEMGPAFNEIEIGGVRALAADKSGNIFIGGRFSHIGDLEVSRVAMFDGTRWKPLRDLQTGELGMLLPPEEFGWAGVRDIAITANGTPVFGGDQSTCGGKSTLNLLCYFSATDLKFKKTKKSFSDAPYVSSLSTNNEWARGGDKLSIYGHLLGKTSRVTIDGKDAKLVHVSDDQVDLLMPANKPGLKKLVLNFNDDSYTYEADIKYRPVSWKNKSKSVISFVLGKFPTASTALTAKLKKSIDAFIKKHPGYASIACNGFIEGPMIPDAAKSIALSQAKNVCRYALKGSAKGMKLHGTKTTQYAWQTSELRRIVITLRK